MKNIKYILFIIVLLFTSCALKKEYVIGDSKGITAKKIVKTIKQNQNKFTSLQARVKLAILQITKLNQTQQQLEF